MIFVYVFSLKLERSKGRKKLIIGIKTIGGKKYSRG